MEERKTFEIRSGRLEEAIEKIKKINKRAAKLGVEPIGYEIGEPHVEGGSEYTPVTVTITHVKIGGWNFRAVVECVSHKDAGNPENIVTGPGADRFAEYRNAINKCDHCGINRYRKVTYIVEHEDGRVKQVGSACLRDYLGHDPQKAIQTFQFRKQLGGFFEELNRGGKVDVTVPLDVVIATTLACIREDGRYINSKKAKEDEIAPTWDKVLTAIGYHQTGKNLEWLRPTEKDSDQAILVEKELKKIHDKVNALPNAKDADDFEYKIYLLVKLGVVKVENKFFAIAVGATAGANWKLVKADVEAEKAKKALKGTPEFFGTVGQKGEFEIEIEDTLSGEGQYGVWVCLKGVQKGTNNKFAWFTNNNCADKFVNNNDTPKASSFKVKATVKDHQDDPKYGKSTLLTRVKIV